MLARISKKSKYENMIIVKFKNNYKNSHRTIEQVILHRTIAINKTTPKSQIENN